MPSLPRHLIGAVALLLAATPAFAQPAAWQLPETPGTPSAAHTADGNVLLARMLDGMEHRVILTAQVRQRIWLGDQETQGEGHYWHQSVGNQRRSRWQLTTLAGGEPISLVQVFDRRHLWTDRRFGDSRRVSRVDLLLLQNELTSRADESSAGMPTLEEAKLLARGGMSQMLAELRRRFTFSPPRQAAVGAGSDAKKTLAMVGQWKPQELARLWYGQPYDPADPPPFDVASWPEQLPHHVVVHCGRTNLFPYLIEFRSAADAASATAVNAVASVARPLARYEFFNEQFAAVMDQQLFQYDPGEVDWTDETSSVVASLLPLEVQPPEEEVALRRRRVR
ncbi:MAG: hypothetical protein CMJ58_19145 [Planctomycetaceae bacterium]|nr:hypothetical protein [Planctomycetaceae bacterium]